MQSHLCNARYPRGLPPSMLTRGASVLHRRAPRGPLHARRRSTTSRARRSSARRPSGLSSRNVRRTSTMSPMTARAPRAPAPLALLRLNLE
eukprot:5146739-Pleurochrysis_carterae.AAC.1